MKIGGDDEGTEIRAKACESAWCPCDIRWKVPTVGYLGLRDIMSKTNRMSALATYVNKTGRFKNQQQ